MNLLHRKHQLNKAKAKAEAKVKANLVDAKIAKDCAKASVANPPTLLVYIKLLIELDGRCSRVGLINPTHWRGNSVQSKKVKTWLDDLSNPRNPKIAIDDDTSRITILD